MGNKHNHCSHLLKHCQTCDSVSCTKCNKEWRRSEPTQTEERKEWTPGGWITPGYYTTTVGDSPNTTSSESPDFAPLSSVDLKDLMDEGIRLHKETDEALSKAFERVNRDLWNGAGESPDHSLNVRDMRPTHDGTYPCKCPKCKKIKK